MHLYVLTKGIKKDVDDFITQLQGKYLPFPWRLKKEDPMLTTQMQLSVRPIQLWEIGFPKGEKDVVCTTILGNEGGQLRGNNGEKPINHSVIKWAMEKCAQLFGAKPIGEYKKDYFLPVNRGAVAVVGLGIKEDYIMDNGVEGI